VCGGLCCCVLVCWAALGVSSGVLGRRGVRAACAGWCGSAVARGTGAMDHGAGVCLQGRRALLAGAPESHQACAAPGSTPGGIAHLPAACRGHSQQHKGYGRSPALAAAPARNPTPHIPSTPHTCTPHTRHSAAQVSARRNPPATARPTPLPTYPGLPTRHPCAPPPARPPLTAVQPYACDPLRPRPSPLAALCLVRAWPAALRRSRWRAPG
jgi:hypothetical protein